MGGWVDELGGGWVGRIPEIFNKRKDEKDNLGRHPCTIPDLGVLAGLPSPLLDLHPLGQSCDRGSRK